MSGAAVIATGVDRAYGSRHVLRGLSLTLRPGEFVAVVGRSGGGKTTLLRLLAGLDPPDGGEVRIDGEPLRGPHPDARILFQDGRLLPWLRVGDNVTLGRRRDPALAAALLERVGLRDRAGDWPGSLSGGQRQRVALARALAAGPRFLLLDEPLASLDALTRVDMQRLIEELWREGGFTALLITHDVEEAVALADRVVLLNQGSIAGEWIVSSPRPRRGDGTELVALRSKIRERVLSRTDSKNEFVSG